MLRSFYHQDSMQTRRRVLWRIVLALLTVLVLARLSLKYVPPLRIYSKSMELKSPRLAESGAIRRTMSSTLGKELDLK